MKRVVITFFLFSPIICFASANRQNRITRDTIWYNMVSADSLSGNKDSANYFLAILPADTSGTYPFLEFDKAHKLTKSGHSTTSAPVKLNYTGELVDYYANGKKSAVVQYDGGLISGKMLRYYPNGQLYTYRFHPKKAHALLVECRDSTGKILAQDGNGYWIFYNTEFNRKIDEGSVNDGLEQGQWQATIGDDIKYTAIYDHGKLLTQNINHLQIWHDDVFHTAGLEPINPTFWQFVSHNIRYPEYAKSNNIQGKVVLRFIVERDGSISEIKVISSPDDSLTAEALRVLKAAPKWRPGIIDDKPIRAMYTIPLNFSL